MLIALVLNRLPLAAALATWGLPLAPGTPVAVGPPPLGEPRVGIASAGAEASGVRHGMLLGEALTLCPSLVLVPPDPAGVQARAAKLISDIDALGLPVEEIAPGRALIDAAPGLRLHGGLQRLIQRLLDIAPGEAAQVGAAPARFAALMAARLARQRPCVIVADSVLETLAPLPVQLLAEDGGISSTICKALRLVGIDRLGGLASLSRLAVRDRFSAAGVEAWQMARGEDGDRITPHIPAPLLRAELRLDEPIATDSALEHAVSLLLTRALADPDRHGREPRLLRLAARLITGESWLCEAPLREPCGEHHRLQLVLMQKARRLPAPAECLSVVLAELAPGARQLALLDAAGLERRQRLDGATDQIRVALGVGALLRVVDIDPHSRLPEYRYGLAPR